VPFDEARDRIAVDDSLTGIEHGVGIVVVTSGNVGQRRGRPQNPYGSAETLEQQTPNSRKVQSQRRRVVITMR
jgi:hypothetical protein